MESENLLVGAALEDATRWLSRSRDSALQRQGESTNAHEARSTSTAALEGSRKCSIKVACDFWRGAIISIYVCKMRNGDSPSSFRRSSSDAPVEPSRFSLSSQGDEDRERQVGVAGCRHGDDAVRGHAIHACNLCADPQVPIQLLRVPDQGSPDQVCAVSSRPGRDH